MRSQKRVLVNGAGGYIGLCMVLGGEPSISLEVGIKSTYKWIENELPIAGSLQLLSAGQH